MFDNISHFLSVIYSKEKQNNDYLNELIESNMIPIGTIIKNQEIIFKGETRNSDILPCIIYKKNYVA